MLYVLVGSRVGYKSGRYQSTQPIDYNELKTFLCEFQEFFEQDGRHNLWVISNSGESQLILDRHRIVYAYGDFDRYESILRSAGFTPSTVITPDPHGHNFHREFDTSEKEVMEYWSWERFPLQPEDDDA